MVPNDDCNLAAKPNLMDTYTFCRYYIVFLLLKANIHSQEAFKRHKGTCHSVILSSRFSSLAKQVISNSFKSHDYHTLSSNTIPSSSIQTSLLDLHSDSRGHVMNWPVHQNNLEDLKS